MKPNSPIHRVKANSIRVYSSLDNVTYTRVDGWKLVPKEKGGLEIVLGTPVTARYVKVKSLFDDRDEEFNPVNAATFQNAPQELIMVYYLLETRQEDYTYDAIGNRKTETITQRYPVSKTYTYYDNSSRLKSNGKYNFEYDNNGNLTKKSTKDNSIVWTYSYDLLNRLISVSKNGQTVSSYVYDESGLRLKKQGTTGNTYYAFDTGGNVLYEQENRDYLEYV